MSTGTPTIFVPNEDEARILKEVIDRVRRERVNTPDPEAPASTNMAPEVYIAQAPVGGIPALTGIQPGSASCQIYRVDFTQNPAVLTAVTGWSIVVYNLSKAAVAASAWIVIQRDKFGAWLVIFEACGP